MNKEIAEAFAARFTPPLNVVATQRINGIPMPDAFMCAYHDDARKIGVTFVIFGKGRMQAYLEATGDGVDDESVEAVADAFRAGLIRYENLTAMPQICGAMEERA